MNEENVKVSIWNPSGIANWSILFSPIFGAWLMSSNWKEIGDDEKAKNSMLWAYAGIALIVITLILNFFVLAEGKSSNGLFLIYFLAWRFTSARGQLKYVKENLSDGYDKKGWMKPILTALGVLIGYIIFILGIATIFSETNVTDEQAGKLPVCVETSDNEYTMSQGSISEVGDYYNQLIGKGTYEMYPRKGGKQLIFKVNNKTILMDTNYIELEKGACMEIVHVVVKDKNGNKGLEADSSNSTDYRTLTKVAEYVFKF